VLIFIFLFGGAPGHAADDEANVSDASSSATDAGNKDNKQCTWACLKWTNLCNVDPRGVYKCRRSCANFGEICE